MKKIFAAIIAAAILSLCAVSALAAPPPVDVEQRNIDGKEILEKTFELSPDEDPNSVIEEPFEKDGFIFNLETVRFEEDKSTLTKDAQQPVSVVTQTDDQSEILKNLSGSIPYTDENGYSGTLYIDTGSVVTGAESYETKYYSVTDTKEYFSMLMNDPTGIPQSTVKNGVTLSLKDISWVVTGTSLAGDSLVPTEYKAVVTYSGSYSKQVPTGYVTTANYKGQLTLEVVGKLKVKVTYAGTPIAVPEPPPEQESKPRGAASVLLPLLFIALLLGGGAAAYFFLFRRIQVEVACLKAAESQSIGKLPLNPHKPILDLSGLKDGIVSQEFEFTVGKKEAARLEGITIAVLHNGRVQKHTVTIGDNAEDTYKFYLDFGGTYE